MKLKIVGQGVFGTFLHNLLYPYVEFSDNSNNVILAVPFSSYEDVASKNAGKHLINVCSIQSLSTQICENYSKDVTSIHPLFGVRTPENKRFSILTSPCDKTSEFINIFEKVSEIQRYHEDGTIFNPINHDQLMAKTHGAAVLAAKLIKPYITNAVNIPDSLIPNSFRLMRDFVKTMDDMPAGTTESILANPYL